MAELCSQNSQSMDVSGACPGCGHWSGAHPGTPNSSLEVCAICSLEALVQEGKAALADTLSVLAEQAKEKKISATVQNSAEKTVRESPEEVVCSVLRRFSGQFLLSPEGQKSIAAEIVSELSRSGALSGSGP